MYVDDGNTRHPVCFNLEQAQEQFRRVMVFLDEYSIEYSQSITTLPEEPRTYMEVGSDTDRYMTVVLPERACEYAGAVEAFVKGGAGDK